MRGVVIGLSVVLVAGCGRAADGPYVSWREHRIDDTALGWRRDQREA